LDETVLLFSGRQKLPPPLVVRPFFRALVRLEYLKQCPFADFPHQRSNMFSLPRKPELPLGSLNGKLPAESTYLTFQNVVILFPRSPSIFGLVECSIFLLCLWRNSPIFFHGHKDTPHYLLAPLTCTLDSSSSRIKINSPAMLAFRCAGEVFTRFPNVEVPKDDVSPFFCYLPSRGKGSKNALPNIRSPPFCGMEDLTPQHDGVEALLP